MIRSTFICSLVSSALLLAACERESARSPNVGTWATPAVPPAPVAVAAPPPAPALAAPARVTTSAALVTPPGWVNYGGIVLPSIPGLTAPAANAAVSGTPAPAAPANGWVTIAGITVPAIPGLTTPVANGGSAPAQSSLLPQGRCGKVTIAGHKVPVDCITPTYGEIPSASRALLDQGALSSGKGFVGAAPLPNTVDHRTDGTEGPIRDQQDVGACTGFSLAAAIDHAYARLSGSVVPVSVMHVWSRYHDPSMNDAVKDNQDHALTAETAWPYDENLACA